MVQEFEKFYGRLRKDSSSLVVTVPSNLKQFAGYSEGDEVVVMMKKKR